MMNVACIDLLRQRQGSLVARLAILAFVLAEVVTAANTTTTAAPVETAAPQLTWQGIVVLVGVFMMVITMALNWISSLASLYGLCTIFLLCGIINTTDYFSGLVNSGMLTIVLMFVIVHPIAQLPVARTIVTWVIQPSGTAKKQDGEERDPNISMVWPRAKLVLFGVIISPFIENVPHVAVITPLVTKICREYGISPSRMLLPMSYAVCVANWFIIGSASNLIIQSLIEHAHTGEDLSFFELAKTSGPVTVLLLPYFIFAPRFLLPDNTLPAANEQSGHGTGSPHDAQHGAPAAAGDGDAGQRENGSFAAGVPPNGSLGARSFFEPAPRAITTAIQHAKPKPNEHVAMYAVLPGSPFVGHRLVDVAGLLPGDFASKVRPLGTWRKDIWEAEEPASPPAGPAEPVQMEPFQTPDDGRVPEEPRRFRPVRNMIGNEDAEHRTLEFGVDDVLSVVTYDVLCFAGDPKKLRAFSEATGLPFVAAGKSMEAKRGRRSATATPAIPSSATGPLADTRPANASVTNRSMRHSSSSPFIATVPATDYANGAADTRDPEMAFLPSGFFFVPIQNQVAPMAVVIVSNEARGIGHRLSSCVFQSHYSSAVIAVRTSRGKHLYGVQLLMHELSQGDTLVIRTHVDFLAAYNGQLNPEFYLVVPIGIEVEALPELQYVKLPLWLGNVCDFKTSKYVKTRAGEHYFEVPSWYKNVTIAAFLGPVAYAMADQSLLVGCTVAVAGMVILGLVPSKAAVQYVDWAVYVTGALSFGIGAAMTKSGLAAWLGQLVIDAGVDGFWLLLLLHVLTALVANVLNNKGSIQVLFPIAVAIVHAKHTPLLPLAVIIANAALGGFLTPYGLGPSLIVMGPGGYAPKDFIIFGGPLFILYAFLSALVTSAVYNFW